MAATVTAGVIRMTRRGLPERRFARGCRLRRDRLSKFLQSSFVGPYAYSTDGFLDTLPIPDDLKIGVVIDAKTVLMTPEDPVSAVDRLFSKRDQSRASLVRIAAHFDGVIHCGPVVERLKSLGYLVDLKIMQMAGRDIALVSELAAAVETWGTVDMLYFADSIGSMDAAEVERITAAMLEGWNGSLGIHAHNNKSLAAFEARSFGKSRVDELLNPFDVQPEEDTTVEPADLHDLTGPTVLIVGAGESAKTYAKDIRFFIEQHEFTVLTLNHQASIDLELVDGVIGVDQHRLAYETDFLATRGKPVFTAQRLRSPSVKERLENADLRQYDCILEADSFAAHDGGCVVPVPLAFG
jgi:hypothetical protein